MTLQVFPVALLLQVMVISRSLKQSKKGGKIKWQSWKKAITLVQFFPSHTLAWNIGLIKKSYRIYAVSLNNFSFMLFTKLGKKGKNTIGTSEHETTRSMFDDVVVHGTIPGPADHEGVFASFTTISNKPKPRQIKLFDYDNTDLTGLFKHLENVDWKQLVYSRPTKEPCLQFWQIP